MGEDGILEVISPFLNKDVNDMFLIEFGAWDGIHLSNTFNLIEKGASSLLIEADKNRFQDLLKTADKFPKIIPQNIFVESDGNNSLDNILKKLKLQNQEVDILSIDIDSSDNLSIWKATEIEPSILVIEFDTRFLPFETSESLENNKVMTHNLFFDTFKYTKSKGYKLIYTSFNMIFVKEDLYKKIILKYNINNNPFKLFDFRNFIKFREISRFDLIKLYLENYDLIPLRYFLLKLSPKLFKNFYYKNFYYKGLNR